MSDEKTQAETEETVRRYHAQQCLGYISEMLRSVSIKGDDAKIHHQAREFISSLQEQIK